jgi:quinol monooxygenase YgiN
LAGVLAMGWMAVADPAAASGTRMFVRHDVTDYGAWRKAYDGFDATRSKMGVTAQAVYRSADDPNNVTVTHDFKTVESAKSFAASAELKATMAKAGVKGAPQIWFTTQAVGSSGKAGKVRMFVRHDVTDYAAWRKAYDGFDATRRKLGVTAQAVYRSVDDPNNVTATHDFKTVESAKSFAASAELKAAMEKAGVKGAPQIWFASGARR